MTSHEGQSSSSSGGWLGSFARSMSGTMLCAVKPSQTNYGVELVHVNMGGPAHSSVPSIGASVSQPAAIPGSTADVAAPAAMVANSPSSAEAVHAPVVSVPAATMAHPRLADANGSVVAQAALGLPGEGAVLDRGAARPEAGMQRAQPIAVKHPGTIQAIKEASWASSGEGLPDALATPRPPDAGVQYDRQVRANQQQEQQQQLQQRQQQSPPEHKQQASAAGSQPTQQSNSRHKVRWLPGLKLSRHSGRDSSDCQAENAQEVNRKSATSSIEANESSNSSRRYTDGGTNAAKSDKQSSSAAAEGSHAGSMRNSQLPPSGSQQLDKYLRYLLTEAHPHSFMYYPGWGMSENGCAAVGEFLRHDRRIKVMTLADNAIRDEGCDLIAEGLAANKMLTSLDLSNNKIRDMGAIALAEALHNNKTLKELKLSNNRIGDEGAEALAAVFAANSTLKKLHLAGNPLSAAQKQVVEHVLKTRVYKLPSKQATDKQSNRHMRKISSLQFHIELSDSDEVLKSSARHRLPPATVIAALSEPADTLECSLATQVAHLMAELQAARACHPAPSVASNGASPGNLCAAQPAVLSSPAADGSCSNFELLPLLALRLAWRGYEVVIRTSVPTSYGSNSDGLVTGSDGNAVGLKHTFVRAVQPGLEADVSPAVVIDPCFQEHFKIPHMTDRYRSVLKALPRVLVLAESRLYHLVEALSSEVAQAFQDSGLTCPPWRDVQVLLDKWLCKTPVDLTVDSDATLESLKSVMMVSIQSAQGQ